MQRPLPNLARPPSLGRSAQTAASRRPGSQACHISARSPLRGRAQSLRHRSDQAATPFQRWQQEFRFCHEVCNQDPWDMRDYAPAWRKIPACHRWLCRQYYSPSDQAGGRPSFSSCSDEHQVRCKGGALGYEKQVVLHDVALSSSRPFPRQ